MAVSQLVVLFSNGRAVVAGGRFIYANNDRVLAYNTTNGLQSWAYTDTARLGTRQSAGGFTLPDRSPQALIYFPDDGGEYASGSSLSLRGAVYDPKDVYLPTNVISWTLSGHGSLGAGENIILDGPEDGQYSLTLTATDGSDQIGSKTISFRIGERNQMYLQRRFIFNYPKVNSGRLMVIPPSMAEW